MISFRKYKRFVLVKAVRFPESFFSECCAPPYLYLKKPLKPRQKKKSRKQSQQKASFPKSSQPLGFTSVLPRNTQDWFPLGWTGWISLQSRGLSRVFSQHHSSKASILQRSAFCIVQLSHPYMNTGKTIALTRQTIVVTCPKHRGPKYEPRYLFFTLTYNSIYSVSVPVLVP